MNNVKAVIFTILVFSAGAFGARYFLMPTPVVQPGQPVGASTSNEHFNPEYFYAGLTANKFLGYNSTSASSSSTTAVRIVLALGSSTHGQLTIGTSTPSTRVVDASSTSVTLNSMVFLQQTATTTIPGVTCNSVPATSTVVTNIFASTTNTSLNGFTVQAGGIPATNPLCYNYWILDKSR